MLNLTDLDERTVHRLEAFSDIVIAFSLTEVGLSLAMPNSVSDLKVEWLNLSAFTFSFTLISIVWWYHHKLLTTFPVSPVAAVMNFVLLGTLALVVYFQQITVHFLSIGVDPNAPLHVWFACMAAMLAVLSAMYGLGVWVRRASLDPVTLRWGISLTYQIAVNALGLVGLCVAFPRNPAAVVAIILLVGVTASFHGRLASRFSKALQPATVQ